MLDHLEDNIRRVIADIRPQMLEKVIENWTSGLDYIRASRGSHMPEIILKILPSVLRSRNRLHVILLFPVLYTSVSVLSCSGKMCTPMTSIEQWYSRRSMAPDPHTVKRPSNSPFADCTTDSVCQLCGNFELIFAFAGYVQYA
ncbi:hypothetical protein TNCV_581081 [Trichonephila clavipes]|nr:hypothetical protein TNCV_581081 [Trichonephila clavipes]